MTGSINWDLCEDTAPVSPAANDRRVSISAWESGQ